MSEQDEQDVLLFKGYDSDTDVRARACLHTAFDLPPGAVSKDAPTRERIEVRALVFTYPATGQRPSDGRSMPQPLAGSLERGHLKRVDVEHSITDRPRTELDEGNEIKDAVLILSKQEIQRLEIELEHTRKQASMQGNDFDLRLENDRLRAEMINVHMRQTQIDISADERTILCQQLERAQHEAQKWRAEAMGYANDAVIRVWQGSVDEAVRREREKDAVTIDSLHAELEGLRIAQGSYTATLVDVEGHVSG
ncbi:hypothetical protein DOTSEDRAFT_20335 [Dothistroma septosporum NZE10]|uniref:Uncharacterized protein n=1 Tax=Dothistroma septosporum (strain NZE10 / CBS 128990) TaxID=675120 RepID=N1Q3X9_DOTSN|nr:hypothetical protein DOTSEDRAFT_20335 [Dothistroma septosporum NZE10]